MRTFIVALIGFYQKTLSPDHGFFKNRFPYGYCRFYPSCSEYTKCAIIRYGVMRGVILGVLRVIKCNPFAEPKIDNVN